MNLTFADYTINGDTLLLRFVVADPVAGEPAEYIVRLTEAELKKATTNSQLRALVTDRLIKQKQATSVAARLDPLLGVVLVV